MASSPNTNVGTTYQISNTKMVAPTEGPRALVAFLNFTNLATSATVDLTQQTQPPAQLSVIQGFFLDNHAGTIDILAQQVQTAQILVIKAGQQAYVPVFATATPVFNFFGAGGASPGIVIPVYFYNVPIAPLTLGSQVVQGLNFNGNNLLVQDTAAEASLAQLTALITNQGSGNGLDVNVISGGGGGGGGGFLGPLSWNQKQLAAGTTAITLYTPTSGKRFYMNNLHIQIDPTVTRTGGSAQNWQIQDGATIILDGVIYFPSTAPTLTAGTPGYRLFDADDMGLLSATVNNTLSFAFSNATTTGETYFNFSTLTGDHA